MFGYKLFWFYSKEEAKEAMVYSYKHSLSGFAATLNASQAAILNSKQSTLESCIVPSWICGLIFTMVLRIREA